MVFAGFSLADSLVFKTREAWQGINRRSYPFAMQRPRQNNLSLGYITGQVRHRMRLVVFRHGQNRDHRDRAFLSFDSACPFINSSKVGIEITGITPSARHFLSRCADFTKCFAVVGHVVQDNQNVHVLLECQILSGSQSKSRRGYSLDGGVVREIDKHNRSFNCTGFGQVVDKELGSLECNTHRCKNHGELLTFATDRCLAGELGGHIIVRQTRTGKDGQLLASH